MSCCYEKIVTDSSGSRTSYWVCCGCLVLLSIVERNDKSRPRFRVDRWWPEPRTAQGRRLFPILSSQLVCDKLPTGYVILPRFVNSPAPPRRAGMSDSAFALLQKTFGNGVCDPNETWGTDPLDCAASGNQLQDPYTGRPGFTVNVCQALPVTDPNR